MESNEVADEGPPPVERFFFAGLAALLVLGLAAQLFVWAQARAENPFASVPVGDAKLYWAWAAEIAGGNWLGQEPFLNAPLYPYFLALIRGLGGGLSTVFAVQLALHLATAALLAVFARRRFGPTVGLVGAALYLLVLDSGLSVGRILNNPLQAFLIVLLWGQLIAHLQRPSPLRTVSLGAVLGLTCLATPQMMAAVPVVGLWVAFRAARRWQGIRRGILAVASTAVVISPATVHNYLVCGEVIPISAHAGITFFHGNQDESTGTYTKAPGISSERRESHYDARGQASEALAREVSWNETSNHFLEKGLSTWTADPADAAVLFLRKAWWFASGRHYGDLYLMTLERQDTFGSRLWMFPVPVAWFTLPAFLALAILIWRRRWKALPEGLLLLLPFFIVCTFWYTPRYRMPAIPMMTVLAAWSLCQVAAWNTRPMVAAATVFAFLLSFLSGPLNRLTGFERVEFFRAHYETQVGHVLVQDMRLDEAAERFRAAADHGDPTAQVSLADVLVKQQRYDEAIRMLGDVLDELATDPYALRTLGVALASKALSLRDMRQRENLLDQAAARFEEVLRYDPHDFQARTNLGNLYGGRRDFRRAIQQYDLALETYPGYVNALLYKGAAHAELRELDQAEAAFRTLLSFDPGHTAARAMLEQVRRR